MNPKCVHAIKVTTKNREMCKVKPHECLHAYMGTRIFICSHLLPHLSAQKGGTWESKVVMVWSCPGAEALAPLYPVGMFLLVEGPASRLATPPLKH